MEKRIRIVVTLAVVTFFLALGVTLYPLLSNWYAVRHESVLHTAYTEQVQQTDDRALAEAWEAAMTYNAAIMPGTREETAYDRETLLAAIEGYSDLLNVTGNGIMGYVEIPKLDLRLPIYHGTNAETLARGIGHQPGSSLPVGGEGTHCVLTAHSGMASQKMFTDIDQLVLGDVFYLHVLDKTLAYQVDQIVTVLPHETDELRSSAGNDWCTLITCTPFAVNTHRLLIRGTRIPYEEAVQAEADASDGDGKVTSTWEQQYKRALLLGAAIAVPLFLTAVAISLWQRRRRRKDEKQT